MHCRGAGVPGQLRRVHGGGGRGDRRERRLSGVAPPLRGESGTAVRAALRPRREGARAVRRRKTAGAHPRSRDVRDRSGGGGAAHLFLAAPRHEPQPGIARGGAGPPVRGGPDLADLRHRGGDEERADDSERSFDVLVPFGGQMRVAGLAARAQRDRGDAERDRRVRVGGGAGELGVAAQRAIGRDRGLHQGMGARRDAAGAIAHELHLHPQRRRALGAGAVLVVRGAPERGPDCDVELRQGAGILAPQVQIEPGVLGDRVEPGAAPQADNGARGARRRDDGEVRKQGGGAPHGVRGVGEAEGGPGMAARAAERDVIAPGAERAVDHALEPRAVQGDEGHGFPVSRFPFSVQEVFDPPQVPRPLLPDRRGEEDGPRRRDSRRDQGLRHRHERREPAGVVRDAGTFEPLAAPLDPDVHLGTEHRVRARGAASFDWTRARVDLNDETLRDGLQSPSVRDPALDVKQHLLHLMADLGIVAADIGLPGAGPRVVEQVRALATEIRDARLPLAPNCAARTVIADIEPIVRVAHEVGITIEAATFIGSSPIRQYAEDWTLDRIVQSTVEAVTYAVKHGLPVMYVTEDTTRAKPEALKALYGAAIDCGAARICLADTVGHATPDGVRSLINFVRQEIVKQHRVKIDWHGHRDRGLGLINCLAAIEAGVDRVHGTALGVGERVGNAEMDLLIVNLKLLGAHHHDISKLPQYCRLVADAVGVPIAVNYPVMGEDAFRTGTGVHAAAIIKAKKKGHAWLADRVYSSVPAQEFGLEQKIEISPLSGLSNVKYWLETHGYDPEDEAACRALFEAAKRTDRVLSDEECHRLLKQAAWR